MTAFPNARIAVVVGGRSSEAEVSRSSGAAVAQALTDAGAAVVQLVEMDDQVVRALLQLEPDVVFPAVHGAPGEDGTLQGCLEMLGLPYVGSGVAASAAAMHKALAKALFLRAGLAVAPDRLHRPGSAVDADALLALLGGEVVVKPASQGSALGVRFVDDAAELARHLDDTDHELLVEARVRGRELTVGVLDPVGAPARTLPVIEITTPEGSWYDYTHRYTPGLSGHLIPAPISPELTSTLEHAALQAHRALGCRDLSRADFIVTPAEGYVLLEVNTLPGMTGTSLYPDAARHAGVEFPALCQALVSSALARGSRG